MQETPPSVIVLLAHEIRWRIVQYLAESDFRVGELVERLQQPTNLVSYHLKQLRDGDFVYTRRSDVDGRDIYYSLDLDVLTNRLQAIAGLLQSARPPGEAGKGASGSKARVLFICTHNSARSQMAEGLLTHMSGGQVAAFSAGSQPTVVHPDAIRTMAGMGIDIGSQQVNHVNEYTDAPFDLVITVCDQAREICPRFEGAARQIHWGYSDPATEIDPARRADAFLKVAERLKKRIRHLLREYLPGYSAG
jgi:ArsR family transcriptional regulator, arsenate/arsenite/antimonite-responsive transcriptional repressor / arsenate reductase (thioredoxin)